METPGVVRSHSVPLRKLRPLSVTGFLLRGPLRIPLSVPLIIGFYTRVHLGVRLPLRIPSEAPSYLEGFWGFRASCPLRV